jgi:hypothetical protein
MNSRREGQVPADTGADDDTGFGDVPGFDVVDGELMPRTEGSSALAD